MADTNNARAALMRLRDEFDDYVKLAIERLDLCSSDSQRDACAGRISAYRQCLADMEKEIDALPADEMSPPFEGDPKDCAFKPRASSALVELGRLLRSMIAWAQNLIQLLPGHYQGRNSWLLNYGVDEVSRGIREDWERQNGSEPITLGARIWKMIDGLAAERSRPADEAAGASAGLVEAIEDFIAYTSSDQAHSYLRKLNDALAAERARKPQPDEPATRKIQVTCTGDYHCEHICETRKERDKTIAELRDELGKAMISVRQLCGAHVGVPHDGCIRCRAEKAEAEAARYRETLVSRHGGEPIALLDELDELRAANVHAMEMEAEARARVAELREQLAEANAAAAELDQKNAAMQEIGAECEIALRTEIKRLNGQLAEARKAGLRELREWFVGERTIPLHHPNPTHYGPPMTINGDEKRIILLAIDRLLAADSEHKEPDSEHNAEDSEHKDDDATLREFVQWFESPGRHDIQPPVRAAYVLAKQRLAQRGDDDVLHRWLRLHRRGFHDDAFFDAREGALSELCRRALGVTGGGRKEVGDGEA